MSKFNKGDKVLVNHSLVATILTYDEDSNNLVFVARVGGGTDTTYAHISNTHLELLEAAPVEAPAETEQAAEPEASA